MNTVARPVPARAASTAAASVHARTAVIPALGSGTRRLRRRGGGRAGAQALRLGGVAAARIPAQVPIDGGGGAPVAQRRQATGAGKGGVGGVGGGRMGGGDLVI